MYLSICLFLLSARVEQTRRHGETERPPVRVSMLKDLMELCAAKM